MAVAVPSSIPVRDDEQAPVEKRRSISVDLEVEDAAFTAVPATRTRAKRQSIRSRLRQSMEWCFDIVECLNAANRVGTASNLSKHGCR